jgi:hypothetical protein
MGPAFMPVPPACLHLGISRTRLYEHLVPLDPDILVQVGGRTLVDMARAFSLIDSMPRGPRKPSAPGRSAARNIAAKERATK